MNECSVKNEFSSNQLNHLNVSKYSLDVRTRDYLIFSTSLFRSLKSQKKYMRLIFSFSIKEVKF